MPFTPDVTTVLDALKKPRAEAQPVIHPPDTGDDMVMPPDPGFMGAISPNLQVPIGNYVGQLTPGTPEYKQWIEGWGSAVRKPTDPAAFMKGRPEGEEGATFPGSEMLWLRNGQPKDGQSVPMSLLEMLKQNG